MNGEDYNITVTLTSREIIRILTCLSYRLDCLDKSIELCCKHGKDEDKEYLLECRNIIATCIEKLNSKL